MTARRAFALTAAITLAASQATARGQEVSLSDLLQRIGRYASSVQVRLADVVAEERYVQDVTYRNLPPNRVAANTHRELRSDFLLIRTTGNDGYTAFRDVFEVDGRAVRDRQDRLSKLFLNPSPSAAAQIGQIARESARYNIGNVERTINTPTLPLQVLATANQARFRFVRARTSAAALMPRSAIAADTVIDFDETARPTLIRTPGGLDLPVRGRVWADAASGRVAMTELVMEDQTLRATIDVSYRWDDRLELMVPGDMRERYDVRRDGAVILGSAVYANVRQFRVGTDERLGAAAPDAIEPPAPAAAAPPPSAPTLSSVPLAPRVDEPPSFRTRAEVVLVDVVVTDRARRAVAGLDAKDFIVKEDGRPQSIVSFEAFGGAVGRPSVARAVPPDAPLASDTFHAPDASTVVLVDDIHLTPDQAARLRPALHGLLITIGTRTRTVMLVSPASNVSVGARSGSVSDLSTAIDRIAGHRVDEHTNFPIADAEALAIARRDLPTIAQVAARFRRFNPELSQDQAEAVAIEQATQVAHDARSRRDQLYDVALASLDWLAAQPGRHGLIVVSGGFAADPDDAKYHDVVTRSLYANAPIDVLDARGLSGFDRYHDVEFSPLLSRSTNDGPFGRFEAAEGTLGMAIDTGGIAVANRNDMTRGLDELLDSMTTYYLLAYRAPAQVKPGYRRIKVEVRVKGLRVRARTGYFSP
jgi:VWFA-related protein